MDHSVHNMHVSSRWSIQLCQVLLCSTGLLWLFYPPSYPLFEGRGFVYHVLRYYCIQTWLMFFPTTLCIWDTLYYFLALLCQHVMYHSTYTSLLSFIFMGSIMPPLPQWGPLPQHERRLALVLPPLSLSYFKFSFISLSLSL